MAPAPKSAAAFLDTAPSWEELQALVEARQVALHAVPADLETVRCWAAAGGALRVPCWCLAADWRLVLRKACKRLFQPQLGLEQRVEGQSALFAIVKLTD